MGSRRRFRQKVRNVSEAKTGFIKAKRQRDEALVDFGFLSARGGDGSQFATLEKTQAREPCEAAYHSCASAESAGTDRAAVHASATKGLSRLGQDL